MGHINRNDTHVVFEIHKDGAYHIEHHVAHQDGDDFEAFIKDVTSDFRKGLKFVKELEVDEKPDPKQPELDTVVVEPAPAPAPDPQTPSEDTAPVEPEAPAPAPAPPAPSPVPAPGDEVTSDTSEAEPTESPSQEEFTPEGEDQSIPPEPGPINDGPTTEVPVSEPTEPGEEHEVDVEPTIV